MSFTKPLQSGQLDWLSFSAPDDIHAPHPDLFEFELDNSLNAVDQSQLQLLNIDFSADPYTYYRGDNAACGPPSTITISSESAYESPSASLYSFPRSPTFSSLESVYSNDFRMNFTKFSVDCADAPVAAPQPVNPTNSLHLIDDTDADSNSFGELPVSPYASSVRSSNYDYDSAPSVNSISAISPPEFYISSQPRVAPAPQSAPRSSSTLAPISIPLPIPRLSLSMSDVQDPANEATSDSRRKYQCPSCPRAFARAYNLKTHMATHDPHRLKPFACPHKSCGRSFSRKHDLGRHLVSIHHDDPESQKIGVQGASRTWCDTCGKGWTSASSACGCAT